MELNKLITRTVHPTTPVRIEYEVTEYTESLTGIFEVMIDWGLKHREKIKS